MTFSAAPTGFIDPQFALSDSFSASGMTQGTIDKAGFFSWTPSVYDAGRHTITVTVTDSANHSASSTVSILVASTNVLVTNVSPGVVVALHRPFTFTMTAPGFIAPTYAVYDSYGAGTLSSNSTVSSLGVFTWTPTTLDDLGTHLLSVRASDLYGHSAETTQSVTVINPSVTVPSLTPGGSAGVGSDISFIARAHGLATPTYSISDAFFGTSTVTTANLTSTTGVFSWQPTTSDIGLHTLTVTAADTAGNAASTTVTLLITTAPATHTSAPAATAVVTGVIVPSSGTASSHIFTTSMWIGSHGAEVLALQKYLTSLGFYSGPETGYFGPLTSAGVKNFQGAHGISRVGFVGPLTRKALNGN